MLHSGYKKQEAQPSCL